MAIEFTTPAGLDRASEILTAEALSFVEALHHHFADRRAELLGAREQNRRRAAETGTLDFLPETREIREGDWTVAPAPPALQDRRVEMTGPASPAKMAINALNSGAKVWLADLEDASSPTWHNQVDGVLNLRDAARGTLSFTSPEGKQYALRQDAPLAVVVTRPRGWHLPEHNVTVDGQPASGALVDFGLHFFHTAKLLLANGHGPYYYLPKLESHLEARLWNDVFTFAEEHLGIEHGTVRATVLIETIPAAFQMDEILWELREHASGLNAGRWDYLFSIIKYFRDAGEKFVLADRSTITMTAPLMRAYTELLVRTCHRRGAFAMGGMAAVIPNRRDQEATEAAFAKVRADKTREADDGFDGSWVAHPDLVPTCREVFDGVLGERPNQVDRLREDVRVSAEQLLDVASAGRVSTQKELAANLYVAIRYTAVWLSGNGAVAIHNLMEDAATAEISRSQIWQQIRNGVVYEDTGNTATRELVAEELQRQKEVLREEVDPQSYEAHFEPAAALIADLVLGEDYVDFLTLPAYELLEQSDRDRVATK
ncbi:malate synthase A [Kocuria rosea]|uniref:malate synthase A n=1 Tax=Kocuria TaxID=57493 RepID=UPI0003650185|nr:MULTISPECIES: malate synthase A [Kocuria]EYT54286.1 malate synthase [Kocuria sp. UCD-OTCP]MEB2529052.1 malate synthase A [Kocuria rosea]MEB2619214.1 malate synthase A [Kocuria rosea]PWF87134.1 malate synthase A [Kocuria rosea]QCY34138.1 malate synthase A [Kocuria rosea]